MIESVEESVAADEIESIVDDVAAEEYVEETVAADEVATIIEDVAEIETEEEAIAADAIVEIVDETRPRLRPRAPDLRTAPTTTRRDPGGSFRFLTLAGRIRTVPGDVLVGDEALRRDRLPARGPVLAWPERRTRGAHKGTGVRPDGSLRQVHGPGAQGPDTRSGRSAAVQPQLHRHGASAPGPRPRGRGRGGARAREHERRAAQGPDRRRVHHRSRRPSGRR